MSAVTVVLALLAALANASASVLQRRAATDEPDGGRGARQALRLLARLLRRPYWLAGAALLAVSTGLQAAALAAGGLALVQPLLASELLFTLLVGGVVFGHAPDRRTWCAFVALALGLALFLAAAAPSEGRGTALSGRWPVTGVVLLAVVAALTAAGSAVRGAPRAGLLGLASAVCFAGTAALMKEVMGRLQDGFGRLPAQWPLYATVALGVVSFLLLQGALRAGTLAVSQPALTLGDALTSVALGCVLFEERIGLGGRVLPEVIGVLLIGAGTLGLARAPSISGAWDRARPGRGAVPGTSGASGSAGNFAGAEDSGSSGKSGPQRGAARR
ncbi:DMT family transporter [Streptomyces longwoodensis]|uniref:DMT family transporter n=1 Tax=Streptomyces longwoodensis TaxID=68231 RepID=UPI002E81F108|nr:DMT family transporter [Streptomyces longwoodensis]WUC56535.1 DMT family transporter [Streptomyces longwoodensis]WUC70062.1 DMT family transporter [Streptomyces longwoodensis]